jgi:hypothetical protein
MYSMVLSMAVPGLKQFRCQSCRESKRKQTLEGTHAVSPLAIVARTRVICPLVAGGAETLPI